ncbi:MAG: hypothetical protein HC927_02890 [Deltaproteobacteria bacterium]|nr:hypothetical protein [Deltaproteobacteria bacterium]
MLVLLSLAFLSCQERLIDAEDESLEGYVICTVVNAARVYDQQGNPVSQVIGPEGGNSEVCLCLTPEDTKAGIHDDYFNDKALEICLEDAARMGYPEANDCHYWHSIEHWKTEIRLWPWHEDERCDLDGEAEAESASGCSVR